MKGWLLTLLCFFTFSIFAQNDQVITKLKGNTSSQINWTTQYIETQASYKIDTLRFRVRKQAVKMAVKNAQVIAKRNLLKTIQELKVTKRVKVYHLIEQSDKLRSNLKSHLKKAELVDEPIEQDGKIVVSMRIPIYGDKGIALIIHDELITQKPLAKSIQNSVVFVVTNSIIGTTPSLFPEIKDVRGNLIVATSELYTIEAKYQLPIIRNSTLSKKVVKKEALANGYKVVEVHRDSRGDFILKGKNAETFKLLVESGAKIKEAIILMK